MAEQSTAQGSPPTSEQGPQSDRERLDEIYKSNKPQAATAPEATPQGSLWERLKDRLIGEGAKQERERDFKRLREMARAVPRAATNLVNSAVRSTAEAGAFAADKLGIGGTEEQQNQNRETAKGVQAVEEETMNRVLGPRSDDPVASLTESLLQGIGSVALLRGAGVKNLIVSGAITDAFAFNPYEASVSEALAQHGEKLPVVGGALTQLGKLGSVGPEDGAVISRAKRVVEGSAIGGIIGKALDVAVWGTRKVRAQAVIDSPTTKPAERAAAEATVKQADETIEAIADGTHTPEGARVVARPNGDGTWRVEPTAEQEEVLLKKAGETTLGDKTQTTFTLPNGDEAIVLWSKQEDGKIRVSFMGSTGGQGSLGPGNVRQVMRQLRDETGATKVTGERVSGANPGREAERELPGPRMTRAEAETQAATMDFAVRQADSPKGAVFSEADVRAHFEVAEKIKTAKDSKEALDIVGGEDHFNLGAIEDGEDFNAQLRALISRYQESFNAAKGRPSISNEATIAAAESYAREIGITDWVAQVAKESEDPVSLSVKTVLKVAAARQVGSRLTELAVARAARPHDPALLSEARRMLDVWHAVGLDVMGHRSELGRSLQILQSVSEDRIGKVRFSGEGKPATEAGQPKPKKEPSTLKQSDVRLSDAMSDEEVDLYLRLFQRGGGEIRNVHAVVKAMEKGMAEQAMQDASKGVFARTADNVTSFFINALISGAKTAQAVAYSGILMNSLEASARILAGVSTRNRGLVTEGAAQWYAHFRYTKENIRSAAAAYRHGGSVLEGAAPMNIRGGVTGALNAVSGRVLGSIDEFTRVAAYRSEEFGKALRRAQESGLSGTAAVKQAEADVRFSIDESTGIGLNPIALAKADVPTLSSPLGQETAGGLISQAINKLPPVKFVVPFVRPSVNVFRYVWQNTPGLNWANSQSREIMMKGGEEAAVLHARSAIAGSMMFYTYSKFMSGEATGEGPSDPALRKIWMEAGNQPYSLKVGGEWVSYRRFEPFASWISLVADASEAVAELNEDGDLSAVNGFAAAFTATVKNSYNKAWMTGLARVLDAAGDGDAQAWSRVVKETAAGFVPANVSQFNDDPYLREARTVVDALRARVPGLSKDLPAKYNVVGEPSMKQGSLWNRNFSVAPVRTPNERLLEETLLENNIGLNPFPSKIANRQIDLLDQRWEKNGKLAYVRFMEILQGQNLRKQLEDRIKSPDWKSMSPGTATFPGGEREAALKVIKDREEQQALRQLLNEYEKTGLRTAYQGAQYMLRPAAKYNGPDAEAAARQKYGVPVPQ